MNVSYEKYVLLLSNLPGGRCEAVQIPESVVPEHQKFLEGYAMASVGFREFCFALDATAETCDEFNENESVLPLNSRDIVSESIRHLFKLG